MESGVVFTYGDTCHTKSGTLPEWLVPHEEVHSRQQVDPEEWWERYFIDPQFRFEQELEAYQVQYKWILEHYKDRNKQAQFLNKFASDLSGQMYGNLLTHSKAYRRIKNG